MLYINTKMALNSQTGDIDYVSLLYDLVEKNNYGEYIRNLLKITDRTILNKIAYNGAVFMKIAIENNNIKFLEHFLSNALRETITKKQVSTITYNVYKNPLKMFFLAILSKHNRGDKIKILVLLIDRYGLKEEAINSYYFSKIDEFSFDDVKTIFNFLDADFDVDKDGGYWTWHDSKLGFGEKTLQYLINISMNEKLTFFLSIKNNRNAEKILSLLNNNLECQVYSKKKDKHKITPMCPELVSYFTKIMKSHNDDGELLDSIIDTK